MNMMQRNIKHVEHNEGLIRQKELALEKKETILEQKEAALEHKQSGNGMLGEPFTFGQPRIIHLGGDDGPSPFSLFDQIGDMLKNSIKTGPAMPHHMGPLMPFGGNILRPGAHPSFMIRMHHELPTEEEFKEGVKKDEPKKEETKDITPKKID